MPELPEVEVLVRQLDPLLRGRTVRDVAVNRRRVLGKTSPTRLKLTLKGQTFSGVTRRGKFLVFSFVRATRKDPPILVGHLGMTGRMYLHPRRAFLPKHAAVVLDLGRENFVFEDTRYFGKFTLDTNALDKLGPEPLDRTFTFKKLAEQLGHSKQPIKVKLLDQSVLAGIGNIYASEALFRAGISPAAPANQLTVKQIRALWNAIRKVLLQAIRFGSTVPLKYESSEDQRGLGKDRKDNLFYFGTAPEAPDFYERLKVYDRAGRPCGVCGTAIQRILQGGRSTFYCEKCQGDRKLGALRKGTNQWLQR
jgi:formamidopyrimidine-DNA glycosylase